MKIALSAAIAVGERPWRLPNPPQELAKMQKSLVAETSVVAQMVFGVPARGFVSHGNPKTLQNVFLESA